MICKYCQREIADNSRFCKYCGSILSENQTVGYVQSQTMQGGAAAEPPKKKKGKLKKFFLVLIFTFLILSIIGTVLLFIFFPPNRYYTSEFVYTDYYESSDGDFEEIENHYWYDANGILFKRTSPYNSYECKFDEDGKIIKIIFEYGEDEDSEKTTLDVEYSETKNGYSGEAGKRSEEYHELEYNKNNQLVSWVTYNNNKKFQSETRSYNFLGHMTYCETIYFDLDGEENSKYIEKFDYKGDPTIYEFYSYGTLTYSCEYTNGKISKSSDATVTSTEDNHVAIEEYTNTVYDENGFKTEEKVFNVDDEQIGYTEITSQDDSRIEFTSYRKNEDTGKYEVSGYEKCKLDENGYVTKHEVFDEENELISYTVYEYDEYGNILKVEEFNADEELTFETEYKYEKRKIVNW